MRRELGWLRRWRELIRDRRGNAAMMFGLALLPLMGATGLAVDTMTAYNVENHLQRSLDSAALAAGRALEDDDIEADAEGFLAANFSSSAADLRDFDIVTSEDGTRITLTATAELPTAFMRIFGKDSMAVTARTVINREVRQMELALVLDNTGSMHGTPFSTMQAAAHDLVDIVYGDLDEHPNLMVAVVPYVAVVNIGSHRTSWLDPTDPVRAGPNPYPANVTWKGCVMARGNGYDQTDDPPSVRRFRSYLYPDASDNDWGPGRSPQVNEALSARNDGYGPNLGCGPAITPLMARKADVHAALDRMGAWHRGGTAGNEGLVWGWRALSPRWRGLWGGNTPADRPFDYDTELTDKIIVMLTDGNNEVYDHPPAGPRGSDYTSFGRLEDFMGAGSNRTAGRNEWNRRMTTICGRVKATGTVIYTITFGGSPNQETRNLYSQCATRPEFFFHAPDNATLRTVFRQVGRQLSGLRIAE